MNQQVLPKFTKREDPMEQTGPTRRLAAFISQTSYDQLPIEVRDKSKELILDQLGVALASSTLPWNRKVLEYVQDMGINGDSRVIGTRYRTSIEYAALIKGTFGHGFELDDYCTPCGAHVGCIVLPAALAVAEKQGASGLDFLTAFALGAEMVLRVGLPLPSEALPLAGSIQPAFTDHSARSPRLQN